MPPVSVCLSHPARLGICGHLPQRYHSFPWLAISDKDRQGYSNSRGQRRSSHHSPDSSIHNTALYCPWVVSHLYPLSSSVTSLCRPCLNPSCGTNLTTKRTFLFRNLQGPETLLNTESKAPSRFPILSVMLHNPFLVGFLLFGLKVEPLTRVGCPFQTKCILVILTSMQSISEVR